MFFGDGGDEFLECLNLIMSDVGKWRGWLRISQYANERFRGLNGHISWGWVWYRRVLGKTFGRVGDSFRLGFDGKDSVTLVMFHCWTNVPAFDSMWVSCCSLLGFLMYYDLGAGWRQWCLVEIEVSFEDLICGDFGIASRGAE